MPDYVLELPNDLDAIHRAVAYMIRRGEEAGFELDRLRLNFRVGVTEALVNAVVYGNEMDPSKRVHVEASFEPARVRIRITDEGTGFDPGTIPDPTLPDNRSRAGGRGVFLIRSLMDEVRFNDRGNSVTMILRGRERRDATAAPPPAAT